MINSSLFTFYSRTKSICNSNLLWISLFLYLFFGLSFRLYYSFTFDSSSSRYFAATILFFYPFFIRILSRWLKHGIIFYLVIVVLLILQLLYTFCSFRNIYVSNVNDYIDSYSHDSNLIFVQQKEFYRVMASNSLFKRNISDSNTYESINKIIRDYSYWGHPVIFVFKSSSNNLPNFSLPTRTKLSIVSRYKTNKISNHYLWVFRFESIHFDDENLDYNINQKNILNNSNLEIQQSASALSSKFKLWIDDGAIFYNKPFLLPKNIELPTYYHLSTIPFYPIAFSDFESFIEGKCSLHVKFNYPSYNNISCFYVSLLNTIKSSPGCFSFYIKSLNPLGSEFILNKTEGDNQKHWFRTPTEYHFFLNDSQIHRLSFDFNKSDFSLENSSFLLFGTNAEAILDLIQFVPY